MELCIKLALTGGAMFAFGVVAIGALLLTGFDPSKDDLPAWAAKFIATWMCFSGALMLSAGLAGTLLAVWT